MLDVSETERSAVKIFLCFPMFTWIHPRLIKSFVAMYSSISSSFSVSHESVEGKIEPLSFHNPFVSSSVYLVRRSVSVRQRVRWCTDCPSRKADGSNEIVLESNRREQRTFLPAKIPQVSISRTRRDEKRISFWSRKLRNASNLYFVPRHEETSG